MELKCRYCGAGNGISCCHDSQQRESYDRWKSGKFKRETGIPARYENITVEGQQKKISAAFNGSDGVFIYGSVGAGKTHLACYLLKRMHEAGYVCKFVAATEMIRGIRDDFDKKSGYIDKLKSTHCLLIDDIGKEPQTEWTFLTLCEIIDTRYRELKPTLFTSQYSPAELAQRYAAESDRQTAEAIVSRINGMCSLHRLEHGDRRIGA